MTGATFSISGPDGAYDVEWFGVDSSGLEEKSRLQTVQLDNTSPQITFSAPQPTRSGAQMTVAATDSESGVLSLSYRVFLQGTNPPPYKDGLGATIDIAIKGEGTFEVDVQATDNVGNVAPQQTTSVQTDTTPPQTALTIGAPSYPANPTFVTPSSKLVLSATDAGSGVQSISYRVYAQGGAVPGFTSTPGSSLQFTISGADGPYQVEYKATDNAGNAEVVHVQTITLDSTPPQSQLAVGDPKSTGATTFVASSTKLTVNSVDPGSGVASISYRSYPKAGPPSAFTTVAAATASFTLTGLDGDYDIDYQAVDDLGNTETIQTGVVSLDASAPTIKVTSPTASNYVQAAGVNLVLAYTADDGQGSGVGALTSTLDGVATADGQSIQLTNLAKGSHTFVVKAVDKVGNTNTSNVQFTVS